MSAAGAPARAPGGLNPGRAAAMAALVGVEKGERADGPLDAPGLSPRDRGLASFLALGVLRRRGALDQRLAEWSTRPIDQVEAVPRNALRMGLFELVAGRAEPHAVVSQAVEACRGLGAGHAAGYVNAVLRRATRAPLGDDPGVDLPPWLRERFGAHRAWLERLALPARVALATVAEEPLAGAEGPASAAGEVVPRVWWWPERQGDLGEVPAIASGAAWVMDPAAARVADLAVEAAGPGGRVLDACAAPGGKTLRLSASGVEVVAVDRRAARLERLRENLARTRLTATVLRHDWERGPEPTLGTFDLVLVDAPCTALGTLRRHPEVRWTRGPSDPLAMGVLQRGIVAVCAEHVRPGGALVYAVCSPLEEEGERVVEGLAGFELERRWSSFPPQGDEDAHQAFVLRRGSRRP